MFNHGLSSEQLAVMINVLRIFAKKIDSVGLFGSRAQGKARKNSDIDLVIYGSLSEPEIDRLWTLFDQSSLAVKVDINLYSLTTYPPLKAHIDAVMQPLFSKADLLSTTPSPVSP
ncbi:MAG: nucleotidyltransferase domain-containing protein [Alphaproteobacteria bacterium]|jgi:predicted nucleotidyltransferase|nr:nucleotidyltransferase domain-containing protein [Alphaproteobacteria bacterium]